MRRIACSLIATGFLATAFAAEIPHISGGVGVENRDEMRSVAQNYNLHLVFTQNRTGAYLADVAVRISNANGEKILHAVADGPWLYADLPAGAYTVTAEQTGKTLVRRVEITGGESKTLHFNWS